MELKELVNDLTIACTDEVCESIRKGYSNAEFKWFLDDGYFIVKCYSADESVAIDCHTNDGKEKKAPLLCAYLKKKLQENDFWEEAYNAYPEENPNPGLDPAFSSWDDYYDYKYR